MPRKCQTAQCKFALPDNYEKCLIWLIWHYKMPVGSLVLQLQIMISVVIIGPVCDVKLFLHKKFMDFDAKVQHMCKIVQKCQESHQMPNSQLSWISDFHLALVMLLRRSRVLDHWTFGVHWQHIVSWLYNLFSWSSRWLWVSAQTTISWVGCRKVK